MLEKTTRKDDSKEAVTRMSAAIENAPYVLHADIEPPVVEAFCTSTKDLPPIFRVEPGPGK
jgi:hypothetical protein